MSNRDTGQWDWEAARELQLSQTLLSSPAQRLEWLEQAIRLAHQSGALARYRANKNK